MMTFPDTYGRAAAVHYIQAEVRGSAVHDLEHTFRERWYGSSVLDVPSPLRQLYDRTYHMGAMTSRPLPEPAPDDPTRHGPHAIQVLRTYAARLRHYPFAPHGERSIAHAYRKAFACARCQVYVEGQYLWSRPVADIIASALRDKPDLHVIVAVPHHPDSDGPITRMPGMLARHDIIRACTAAGGSRFAVYDLDVRDVADLLHSAEAFEAFRRQAQQLAAWHQTDRHGRRPRGRVSPHRHINSPTAQRLWATPLYRLIYDLDGRTWRDRFRGRLLHRRRTGLLTAYAALPGLQCVIELRDALAWIPVPRCWQKARSPAYRTWAH